MGYYLRGPEGALLVGMAEMLPELRNKGRRALLRYVKDTDSTRTLLDFLTTYWDMLDELFLDSTSNQTLLILIQVTWPEPARKSK